MQLDTFDDLKSEIERTKADRVRLRLVRSDDVLKPIGPRTRFERIVKNRTSQPELISALAGVAFGAWVGNPLFSVFESSEAIYQGVASIAPEAVWGLMLLVPGLVALRGLLVDSRYSMILRRVGAGGLFSFWSAALVGACIGPSLWTTAPIAYSVMVGISGWSIVQLD